MLPASMRSRGVYAKYGKQGRASSWTDLLSLKPPRWVFWLVRPR